MKRRDLSAVLFAAAGAGLVARDAQASGCTAPCYPRDPDTEPLAIPVNTAYPRGNVLRYGADKTGVQNSTNAFTWALQCNGTVYVPKGIYSVMNVPILHPGRTLRGESRYDTVLRPHPMPQPHVGQALICNTERLVGSTTGHAIENLHFQLHNGTSNVPCTAIDLGSVGNTIVRNCRFDALGGQAKVADGVLFDAPLQYGSYSNAVVDCDFTYLATGVRFATGANCNMVIGGEFIHCDVGIDAAPAGQVDSPRVYGSRIEGCGVGLKERALQGMYFGIRFEDNALADVDFIPGSYQPQFFGGLTATTATPFRNPQNAVGLVCVAPDLYGNSLVGRNVLAPEGNASNDMSPTNAGTVAAYVRGGRMVLDNAEWLVSRNSAKNGIMYLIMGSAAGVVEVGASGKVDIGNTDTTHRTRVFKPSFLLSGGPTGGSPVNKFPVYDANGSLVGYVPVYAS